MIVSPLGKERKRKSYSLVISGSQVVTFIFLVFLQTKEGIQYHLHSKVSKQREIER